MSDGLNRGVPQARSERGTVLATRVVRDNPVVCPHCGGESVEMTSRPGSEEQVHRCENGHEWTEER